MTSIPAPYTVSTDAAARSWWARLSAQSRDALTRSWADDERPDPLQPVAQRAADYLNEWILEREQPRDPTSRELWRRGLAVRLPRAEAAGWDWAAQGFYEYRVAHADFREPAPRPPTRWDDSMPGVRTLTEPGQSETLARGSWWAL